jgi:hypothetical protein
MVTPAGLKDQPAEVHAPVSFLGRGQDRITINVVLSSGWHLPAGLKRTHCPWLLNKTGSGRKGAEFGSNGICHFGRGDTANSPARLGDSVNKVTGSFQILNSPLPAARREASRE